MTMMSGVLVGLVAVILTATYSLPLDDSEVETENFDPTCLLDIHSNLTNESQETEDDTEEVEFLDGSAQWWELQCEDESECPSLWECWKDYCFPPAPLPSYFRDVHSVTNDTVATYKARLNLSSCIVVGSTFISLTTRRKKLQVFLYSFIDCTGVGKQGCKCPEGFNCKEGKCQPAPGGITPKTVAQVGGVKKLKLPKNKKKPCICKRRKSHHDQRCFRIRCNKRMRCWCDFADAYAEES